MALLHDILLYIWAPEELFLWLKHRKQVHHFSKILWKLHAAFLGVLQGTWVFCSFQKYFCSQLKSLPPSTFCYLFYLIFQNNIAQASGMALGYSCTIMNLSAGETDPPTAQENILPLGIMFGNFLVRKPPTASTCVLRTEIEKPKEILSMRKHSLDLLQSKFTAWSWF